jgi:hypothetical protein
MKKPPKLVWRVLLEDVTVGHTLGRYDVEGTTAGEAEQAAIKARGPMNDGLGHVYRPIAVKIELIARIS